MTDLRRLEYFLGVARDRDFTRAAEQLHVAQPALSGQVRLLEEATSGSPLGERVCWRVETGRLAGPRTITYEIYRVSSAGAQMSHRPALRRPRSEGPPDRRRSP
jgi:Bacterial regulatory helix-turn-helix protein, lysR family